MLSKKNEELEQKILEQEQQLEEARAEIEKYREAVANYSMKSDEYEKLRLRGIKLQKDLG